MVQSWKKIPDNTLNLPFAVQTLLLSKYFEFCFVENITTRLLLRIPSKITKGSSLVVRLKSSVNANFLAVSGKGFNVSSWVPTLLKLYAVN